MSFRSPPCRAWRQWGVQAVFGISTVLAVGVLIAFVAFTARQALSAADGAAAHMADHRPLWARGRERPDVPTLPGTVLHFVTSQAAV